MEIALALAVLVLLLLIGAPIFVALAAGGAIILLVGMGSPFQTIAHTMFMAIDKYLLVAVPFYFLMGNLLLYGGGSKYLFKFMASLVGHLPGGMASAGIMACSLFAAMSGSGVAGTVAIGSMAIPELTSRGYPRPYAAALIAVAGPLGILIPPSIVLIIYGFLTSISVARLFLAGIVPGVLATVCLLAVNAFISSRRKYPLAPRATWNERGQAFTKALPALLVPIVVLGGIYAGIFTATEAAIIASVYCLIIGTLVYRQFTWSSFYKAVQESAHATTMIFIIISTAILLGNAFSMQGWPQSFARMVMNAGLGTYGFLVITALMFLVVGFVLEGAVMQLVIVPLLLPALIAMKADLTQFGILYVFFHMIGEVTPPVGISLYAVASVAKEDPWKVFKESGGPVIAMLVALGICLVVPQISTWLPDLLWPK